MVVSSSRLLITCSNVASYIDGVREETGGPSSDRVGLCRCGKVGSTDEASLIPLGCRFGDGAIPT